MTGDDVASTGEAVANTEAATGAAMVDSASYVPTFVGAVDRKSYAADVSAPLAAPTPAPAPAAVSADPTLRLLFHVGLALIGISALHVARWLATGETLDGPLSIRRPILFFFAAGLLAWLATGYSVAPSFALVIAVAVYSLLGAAVGLTQD